MEFKLRSRRVFAGSSPWRIDRFGRMSAIWEAVMSRRACVCVGVPTSRARALNLGHGAMISI